jgi:2-dehydro-3-deoxyglucarate aldolase
MHTGTLAGKLRDGDSPVGAWTTIGHPVVAEVLASEAFDFVVLDGEHSENTIGDLAAGVRAVDAADGDTDAVVRVSSADRAELRRVLDLGPAGVIVPQLESAADAGEAVDAAQYPPEGTRGVAGGRASNYGADLAEYVDAANREVATILQIETPGAVEDAREIAGIDGVDALFVGPADLSARLGCFGEFDAPAFRDAISAVTDAAAEAGVPVGTLATDPDQRPTRRDDWGMDFLVAGTDVGYLRRGARDFLD